MNDLPFCMNRMYGFMYALQREHLTGPSWPRSTTCKARPGKNNVLGMQQIASQWLPYGLSTSWFSVIYSLTPAIATTLHSQCCCDGCNPSACSSMVNCCSCYYHTHRAQVAQRNVVMQRRRRRSPPAIHHPIGLATPMVTQPRQMGAASCPAALPCWGPE